MLLLRMATLILAAMQGRPHMQHRSRRPPTLLAHTAKLLLHTARDATVAIQRSTMRLGARPWTMHA
eukprot:2731174-Lingulodinium_polyedra.AAC.1